MNLSRKIGLLQTLSSDRILNEALFYEVLEECATLKQNYADYSSTHPIDCEKELLRLPGADYDSCCALITMLLREDHFSNGALRLRYEAGQVDAILRRMISLIET
jgi:hypothetical protein